MTTKELKNQVYWFIGVCFTLTYAAGWYFLTHDGLDNPLSMLTMYIPALTVIGLYVAVFRKPVFRNNDLGFTFKGLKYWIITPLVISGISLLTYSVSYLFHPGLFDTPENIRAALEAKGFFWGSTVLGLLAVFLVNALIGSLLNIPMFIGEELGWRAFLFPRLIKLYGPLRAFMAGAVLWALWHAFMIADGLNYPSIHPFFGILMMVLFCLPAGVIFQYYYTKSRSVFVAALAHAALNKSAMSAGFLLKEESYNTVLFGPTGIVGIVVFSLVAVILFMRVDWKGEYTSEFSQVGG